jgi:simple sugar transport system ATP-binding protein
MAEVSNFLELRGITKRFPGIVANDNVSLEIRKGEIYAILGENGAGKSTLASMIFGMYEPDEGEIIIEGKPVHFKSANDAVAMSIGMVHQHFKLVSKYTVAQNIILGNEPNKNLLGFIPVVDIKSAEKKIAALSESYGLDVNPKDIVSKLGVSTQQRVEILKMLYRDADFLIFDEPTGMLTPQEIENLLQIIKNLRKEGKTVILITHKLDEIMQVADRCAVLRHGQLIDVLDVDKTNPAELAAKMIGKSISFETEKPECKYGDVVLEAKDLTVEDERKFAIVNDVNFKIHRGEIFAVAGVAGSGQIELADAIAGLARPKHGQILVKGKDVGKESVRDHYKDGISYIPEDRHDVGLVLDFPLDINLSLKNYYHKPFSSGMLLKPAAMNERATKLIDCYDIRAARGSKTITREMSGGNQQKAIIAREIEHSTDLIIFVQPTRGLDVGAIMSIRDRIVQERDKGKAILLISLELDEVMELADTIGVMYGGKMVKVAPAKDLSRSKVGEFMMGVNADA